jgi:hypothetical protein
MQSARISCTLDCLKDCATHTCVYIYTNMMQKSDGLVLLNMNFHMYLKFLKLLALGGVCGQSLSRYMYIHIIASMDARVDTCIYIYIPI